jgi:hypothetical protein
MNELNASIRALDDATAERLLATIARHHLQPGAGTVTTLTPTQAKALANEIGITPSAAPTTPGELARA